MSKVDKNGRTVCIAFAQFSSTWFATRCIKMVQASHPSPLGILLKLYTDLRANNIDLAGVQCNGIIQMGMIGRGEFVFLIYLVGGRLDSNPAGSRPEVGNNYQLKHERPARRCCSWQPIEVAESSMVLKLLNHHVDPVVLKLLNPRAQKKISRRHQCQGPCGPGFCRDRDRMAAVCAHA